jgi:hypothetical protein
MISGPAASDSAGSFLRRPIFLAANISLLPILVGTQLPTTEASMFAGLAFLVAAPVAAPAADELLLPMNAMLSGGLQEWG